MMHHEKTRPGTNGHHRPACGRLAILAAAFGALMVGVAFIGACTTTPAFPPPPTAEAAADAAEPAFVRVSGRIEAPCGVSVDPATLTAMAVSNDGIHDRTEQVASDGTFSLSLPAGWSGTVQLRSTSNDLPVAAVTPSLWTLDEVAGDLTLEAFDVGTTVTIGGALSPLGGDTTDFSIVATDADSERAFNVTSTPDIGGSYSLTLPCRWAGSIVPVHADASMDVTFDPPQRTLEHVTSDSRELDHRVTMGTVNVSGTVRRGDLQTIASRRPITMTIRDASDQVVETFEVRSGQFTYDVPIGFSGSVTPEADDVAFSPARHTFENLRSEAAATDFTAFLTFHVDKDGVGGTVGLERSMGTADFPLANIQNAADDALPGDTVLVRAGTYLSPASDRFEVTPVLEIRRSGLPERPITIKAHTGETVILDAEHKHNECIRVRSQSHVRIEGLTAIRSKGRNIRIEDSEHIVVADCVASDNLIGNLPGFWFHGQCRYCVFERCVSTRNGRGFLLSGAVESDDPTQQRRPRYCTLRHCLAYENTRDAEDSDGFQMLAASDNAIIGCVSHDNGDDGFDLSRGAHRNAIVGCVAYNHPFDPAGDGDGNGFKIGVWGQAPTDSDGGGIDNILARCIAFDNKYGLNNNAIRLRILNNAFHGNSRYGIVFDESTRSTCGESPPCRCDAVVLNNVLSGNVQGDILFNRSRRHPILLSDFNYIGGTTSTNDHTDETGHEQHSVFGRVAGAPGFVSPAEPGVVTDVSSPTFGRVGGFALSDGAAVVDQGVVVAPEWLSPFSTEHPHYAEVIELINGQPHDAPARTPHPSRSDANRVDIGPFEFRP